MRVDAIGCQPSSYGAVQKSPNNKHLSLKGFRMHLFDGGLHGDVMTHFTRALSDFDMKAYSKLISHDVELLPHNKGLKNLKSLEESLLNLEAENVVKAGDSIAIPVTAPVELNRLAYYFNLATGNKETFTPANIKSKKETILDFLTYASEFSFEKLDPEKQGFEHLVNIIQTVNRFVKKGVNVYIPSDHPLEAAIKWTAEDKGIKDKLYRYISTGFDEGGAIAQIIRDLKAKNAYKFNLLTLSDAHIVNLQNRSETGDYIFSAFDSCVTDRARGVYNFYPVRNSSGKILGYSFTDKSTVHYPYHEYPENDSIANIAHFVGRKTSDYSYEGNIVHIMKELISWEEAHDRMPNVPYPVAEIYSPKRLARENLTARGQFVDRTETLFFDLNSDRELIFRRCDCEGSGRPSVASMWGSCFATINLMTKNVKAQIKDLFEVKLPGMMELARQNEAVECYPAAENILQKALSLAKPENTEIGKSQLEYDIATQLAKLYVKQKRIDDVEKLMNETIPDRYPEKRGIIASRIAELRRNLADDNV